MVGCVRRLGVPQCRRTGISAAAALTPGFGSQLFCCQTSKDWSEDWQRQQ